MNEITKTFGTIAIEDIYRCEFLESKKRNIEKDAHYRLKQHGYKFLKKEWKQEDCPNEDLVLKITFVVPE